LITRQHTFAEVALADPDADTAALREMGERVVASCVRQRRLLDALLDLARSRHALTRQREPVDISAIAAQVLRAHDLSEIESVVELEPAQTFGDAQLVARLAANLISNAIRHNLPCGRIEVATRAASGHAVLSVANTGPLISNGELERLFQPFQRANPSTSSDGVGLGLAIVQAIADAHDATVTARAQPGGGLRIDVAFPSGVASAKAPNAVGAENSISCSRVVGG
jgi:signal transduction histidine kinase